MTAGKEVGGLVMVLMSGKRVVVAVGVGVVRDPYLPRKMACARQRLCLRGEVEEEKDFVCGVNVQRRELAASRGKTPSTHLQRPQMDEIVIGCRWMLRGRDQTLMDRANRLALATRALQVQVRVRMLLGLRIPAHVLEAVQAHMLAGAARGGILRESTEPQTNARRSYCGCGSRQNQIQGRGR